MADAEATLFVKDPVEFVRDAAGGEPLREGARRSAEDIAAIICTSGTTGRSKGAMSSHGNLAANGQALCDAWGFTEQDVLLHALPIFPVHGLFVVPHCSLLSGCATIASILVGPLATEHGWRSVFFVAGVPGFIIAVAMWFAIDEPPVAVSTSSSTRHIRRPPIGKPFAS